jgi:DNA-3-methyladenine glycosylase I
LSRARPCSGSEALCLTYFENGLSWATVYRKRDAFRRAFHNFEPAAVAALTGRDVNRLLADRSIIRHRGKIEASIHNAWLVGTGSSLPNLVWANAPRVQPVVRVSDGHPVLATAVPRP